MQKGCPPDWREKFATIYEEHKPRLVRWLNVVFGPRDAEDIAQETLIRLYHRPTVVDDLTDPWPWLSVVARNVGIDVARRNAKSVAVDPNVLNDIVDGEVHEPMLPRDEAQHLIEALDRITPQERQVIMLRDIEGWTVADIAAVLHAKPNAVNQRLLRARRRLAGAYVALNGGEPEFDERPPRIVPAVERGTDKGRKERGDCICGRLPCRARPPAALRPTHRTTR